MTRAVKAAKQTRDELYRAFEDLVKKSMQPGIPIPQMVALKNRAQELRDQWVELEAARFNADTSKYQQALKRIDDAVTDLRRAIKEIDDAIEIAEKAAKVFGHVDKLLQLAVKNLPIVI